MIVEDDAFNLAMLERLVEQMKVNIDIITQIDGEEQYSRFLEYKPQLIFMDVGLPKMDGLETIEQIRKIDKKCKI